MRHPQGALTRCLLTYINVIMQSWWYFFTFVFLESLKHYNIKTVLATINYIVITILGTFFFPQVAIYTICNKCGHINLLEPEFYI